MHVNWKNSFESCLLRKCSTLNHDATSAVTKGRAWKLVLSMASLASWMSCCLIVLFADLSDSFTENRKCRFLGSDSDKEKTTIFVQRVLFVCRDDLVSNSSHGLLSCSQRDWYQSTMLTPYRILYTFTI